MLRELAPRRSLYDEAAAFLELFAAETGRDVSWVGGRCAAVMAEIDATGSYRHTSAELEFGARVAWRNSNRCIGRLSWSSLTVFDRRDVVHPDDMFAALREYLAFATNGGRIRPAIVIFSPRDPATGAGPSIRNDKLVRYAGYQTATGIVGDPAEVEFTELVSELGWRGEGTHFDLLPVVIDVPGRAPCWYEWREGEALEVPIRHPQFEWFEGLGLRWYAVPVVSDMVLEIGGVEYGAAPFNGWFMGTEIGARNLGDQQRYDQLPVIAEHMGLDLRSREMLWKDRALVELNTAVLHSYREAGVTLVDHHTAAEQFMRFVAKEGECGRAVGAEWSWIVPPLAGSATEPFHHEWDNTVRTPGFFYR